MNLNIMQTMYTNFKGFIKLVELGVIDSEIACNAIIESNDAEFIYEFANNIKDANIEKLEDAIIKSNSPRYIYYFARDIKGANIEKLEDAIIKLNDIEFIYKFAKNIRNANIEKLEEAIMESNDPVYIYYFKKEIENDFTNLMKLLDIEDYEYIKENKEKFSKLFIDDSSMEDDNYSEKTLKLK